jgi:hypothetical protein
LAGTRRAGHKGDPVEVLKDEQVLADLPKVVDRSAISRKRQLFGVEYGRAVVAAN